MLQLQGKWKGALVYGKEYGAMAGKELLFEFDLQQSAEKVWGTAMDTGGTGQSPDPANLEGYIEGDTFTFTKQYESLHFTDGGDMILDRTRKGPPIQYIGKYDLVETKFEGTWRMSMRYKLFGFIPVTTHATGTWKLWRA